MRKYLYVIIVVLVVVILGYNYVYQDHRDISSESSEFVLTASEISLEFSNTPSKAEVKYLNKTIEISGRVSEVNENSLTVNDQVFCQFSDKINSKIKIDSEIKIKGRLIGYDDLLEQVKLDQCHILN